MKRTGLLVVFLAGPLLAQQSEPRSHTVVKGDTLWDLSETFYDTPWIWPRIWYANPPITNPDLIYPGQVFVIPGLEDEGASPQVPVQADLGADETPRNIGVQYVEKPAREAPQADDSGYDEPLGEDELIIESVEDELRQSRVDLSHVSTRPKLRQGSNIRSLGNEEFLVDRHEKREAGNVKLLAPKRAGTLFATQDEFWISKGRNHKIKLGQLFLAARETRVVKSPRTKKVLGEVMSPTGILQVVELQEKSARVRIIKVFHAVEVTDLLFNPSDVAGGVLVTSAKDGLEGEVVAAAYDAEITAQWGRVFLDLGEAEGVKRGDVFAVFRDRDAVVIDKEKYDIPSHYIGSVVVIDTSKHGSSALVTRSDDAIRLGDKIRPMGL